MKLNRWTLSGMIVFTALLGTINPSSGSTDAKATLFELINQRLVLMPAVADDKYANGLPVEDPIREKKVLASARHNAELSGLDPDSVQDFFVNQIAAAKHIQRVRLQTLDGNSAPEIRLNLETELRPELLRLGHAIIRSLARLLESGVPLSAADWPAFRSVVVAPFLLKSDRRKIFNGLQAIELLSYPPPGFVEVQTVIPDIVVELRYLGSDNFIGQPIDGYLNARLLLTHEAADALALVQQALRPFGLGLKVFDGYRPQRAVDHFVRWAEGLDDQEMKAAFYPDIDKADLFRDGYIANRSSHSRGSAIDLTLISLKGEQRGPELDMGSAFDFFSTLSWPADQRLSASQRAHRLLLRSLMQKHGFKPYPKEWWHFTLAAEPYPDSYFDFPVR